MSTIAVLVFVPLCDSALIDCGNKRLGDPASLTTNLYWGAGFGAYEHLRKTYKKTADAPGSKPEILREVTFVKGTVTVTLLAYHGAQIDRALADYFAAVAGGTSADVVIWMGHDRLMDVPAPPLSSSAGARPTIVLACKSKDYFGPPLQRIGAEQLLMTRSLMAPEAYLLTAILDVLAKKGDRKALRAAAVDAYAQYQKISAKAASSVFSPID